MELRLNDFQMFEKVWLSGKPNFLGCRLKVESGLNVDRFRELAEGCRDQVALDFLEFGFPINYEPVTNFNTRVVKNHAGARDFPKLVDNHIMQERDRGWIAGPFNSNPLSAPLAISPLNTVPKDQGKDRRFIMDLSAPLGGSVNTGIDKDNFLGEPFKWSLPSIDRIIDCINEVGRGALLFKRDLKRAYRQFPVDPRDWNKLGFSWKGKIYFDKRLTMGLSSAAVGCQRADLLVGAIYSKFTKGGKIVVYLDDFNGICAPNQAKAEKDFIMLADLLVELGLNESKDKAVPPATRAVMLGILFDTVRMTMEVTVERILETEALTLSWEVKMWATKKDVQQLVGKLIFVSKCVRQSRVFLNRILNFLRAFNHIKEISEVFAEVNPRTGTEPRLPVTNATRMDVRWFQKFLRTFNGVSVIPNSGWENPDVTIATDACLIGCGGTCQGKFFRGTFPAAVRNRRHISELEILTVCVAAKLWATCLKGKRITLFCDNEASVVAINSGKCRNATMQACLRELVFVACSVECEMRAVHIRGVDNRLPDFLSRWQFGQKYRDKWAEATRGQHWVQVQLPENIFEFAHDW